MNDYETKKAMVAMWVKRGSAIDAMRNLELANYDPEANRKKIDALLDIGFKNRIPRMTSGLAEMRRLFEKAWLG